MRAQRGGARLLRAVGAVAEGAGAAVEPSRSPRKGAGRAVAAATVPYARWDDVPGLLDAVQRDDGDTVCALVAANGGPHAADADQGRTPLHLAARWDAGRCCAALLRAGADVRARGKLRGTMPLHVAAFNGSGAAALALLQAGADPEVETTDGQTPGKEARYAGGWKLEEWNAAVRQMASDLSERGLPMFRFAGRTLYSGKDGKSAVADLGIGQESRIEMAGMDAADHLVDMAEQHQPAADGALMLIVTYEAGHWAGRAIVIEVDPNATAASVYLRAHELVVAAGAAI